MQFLRHTFSLLLVMNSFLAIASAAEVRTIDAYNSQLPIWGTTWKAGNSSINGYYPTFYTGFAPRSEFPERIHLRQARGNTTRLTVILDDQNISNYLFDLAKRYSFYKTSMESPRSGRQPMVITEIKGAKLLPQVESFFQIIESPVYGILPFVAQGENVSREQIYKTSLNVMSQLNPGRVFRLKFNLTEEFKKWRSLVLELLDGETPGNVFKADSAKTIVALNSLLWGRINYIKNPQGAVLDLLVRAAELAQGQDEEAFLTSALLLFQATTESKYDFRTLNEQGNFESALQCANVRDCRLNFAEFTTIYPTGTVQSSTRDEQGNRINAFANPGLWQFVSRGAREVDNIRSEPYYGWIPKMDYYGPGNGFHNPAVRFSSVSDSVKKMLNIPSSHPSFWSVKRGPVSHGCSRLPSGHMWELRHVFPVQDEKMQQVYFFNNRAQDFDVYDIDGDGKLEIMGVEYLIMYGTQGSSGLARREGQGLEINADRKMDFYESLYGRNDVFRVENEKFIFANPKASILSYLDFEKIGGKTQYQFRGEMPLFEQTYERDKIQFYIPNTMSKLTTQGAAPLSKRIVRLMGRVRGCAPFADKEACGEAAFDREARSIRREIYGQ